MEPYYNSSSSTTSSSSSLLSFSIQKRKTNIIPNYTTSLHSVRKSQPPTKITKKPIAPLPPTPPRVYLIEPVNFKELVQQLTAAPEFQNSSRLQKLAPPPVVVAVPDQQMNNMNRVQLPSHRSPCSAVEAFEPSSSMMKCSPSGWFANLLSPSSNGWFSSFPILSPGTISAFEFN
ncbi:uncharacterized protein LOC124936218 [Impatiens glandulifera]|uniref:uncharacterized protein LOC124936218 n=1 Tax=Impatiens glandulifera TaxID=253017 RepID=UPI001FB142EF|nr:uncharacterized protein LOC124936218 [Impatiens glandulifera]